ncbi:MoxR family ATPase [Dehalogenimonas sp. 4OHTPN]|uniref:MoxR family ATPase n=1 Tax=Dehalogenimonas sp. 4OHTPN TaxID=3166643 RepID=A0AAU8G8U9_9CHLR
MLTRHKAETQASGQPLAKAYESASAIIENVGKVIVGKAEAIRLAVVAILAGGHLLIEDAPGVGKTMLARSLARSLECSFKRLQFTPDMLPGDITGTTVYNQKSGDFEFRPGPVMAQIVLADEINRATPKVQSALLECMEEHQISVDGVTHRMPVPFHVLATQNPVEFEGTFPLPETQLDRFLLRLSLGFPDPAGELTILENQRFRHPIEDLTPVVHAEALIGLQAAVKDIFVDRLVSQYIVALSGATRNHRSLYLGVSPRGSLALYRTAQALALVSGRDYVLPDDVKALAVPVLAHRLVLDSSVSHRTSNRDIVTEIINSLPVPGALSGRN